MSNILIIKLGSLGDLIQANGAIEDIKKSNPRSHLVLLTESIYLNLRRKCPYVDEVLIDKRLPRWNLLYLYKLKKKLSSYNFTNVFDLQNSNRTKFYSKFLLTDPEWSSTITTLEPGQKKKDFDKEPVLDRMELQLKKSNIPTKYTKDIDLNWAIEDLSRLIKQYANGEFILIFPFCSKKHPKKKWPFFKDLISKIKLEFKNKYPILIAPGPNEINESNILNAKIILDNKKPVNIKMLISLIAKAKFIISNDTGPAHIASHLNKNGLVLFGSHTSAKKVSIENSKFKPISVKNLKDLDVEMVIKEVKLKLN